MWGRSRLTYGDLSPWGIGLLDQAQRPPHSNFEQHEQVMKLDSRQFRSVHKAYNWMVSRH